MPDLHPVGWLKLKVSCVSRLHGAAIPAIFPPHRAAKQEHRHTPHRGVITVKPWLNKNRGKGVGWTPGRHVGAIWGPLGHKHVRAFRAYSLGLLKDGKCYQPWGKLAQQWKLTVKGSGRGQEAYRRHTCQTTDSWLPGPNIECHTVMHVSTPQGTLGDRRVWKCHHASCNPLFCMQMPKHIHVPPNNK